MYNYDDAVDDDEEEEKVSDNDDDGHKIVLMNFRLKLPK